MPTGADAFAELIHLEPHGADVLVGTGPSYPWGGLYGGQIVAQALRAAAATVEDAYAVHSLRAYFIRAGDSSEPIRFEVDRIRNGSSFCTRRVVARQAVGAILNLEASFQAAEESPRVQTIPFDPTTPSPEGLVDDSWSSVFERRFVPGTDATGRTRCWFRTRETLAADPLVHACALAYISDDLPTDAASRALALGREDFEEAWFTVSLDHTMWFHRPIQADAWHLQDLTCHGVGGGRGLAIGHAFDLEGNHLATIAQEVLLRKRRQYV